MKIEIGDLVALKSGGPDMTVSAVEGDSVGCRWHDADGFVRSATFVAMTLEKLGPARERCQCPSCGSAEIARTAVEQARLILPDDMDLARMADLATNIADFHAGTLPMPTTAIH